VGGLSRQRIPTEHLLELVERSPLHAQLWRVLGRHTERPLQPNKTAALCRRISPPSTRTSHTRTYFVPVSCLWSNGSTSGPFSRPGSISSATFNATATSARVLQYRPVPVEEHSRSTSLQPHQSQAQFRVDAFNVFNYISPGNPGNTCIDCSRRRGHHREWPSDRSIAKPYVNWSLAQSDSHTRPTFCASR
jgi:hypothetical protein